MEDQILYPGTEEEMSNNAEKPSNTISWLGFGFSLLAFLLLCLLYGVSFFYRNSSGNKDVFALLQSLINIIIFIGIPSWLSGLILSIIDRVKAAYKGGKKWIGKWGIIMSSGSFLFYYLPLVLMALESFTETKDLQEDPQQMAEYQVMPADDAETEYDLILFLDGNQAKCYDDRVKEDDNPFTVSVQDNPSLNVELKYLVDFLGIRKDDSILFKATPDTPDFTIWKLNSTLKSMGYSHTAYVYESDDE